MDNMTSIELGIAGTATSTVGTALSVTEVQAIVSIIVTVAGFILGVVIPGILKIKDKIKKAKEDGVVTKEEIDDIVKDGKEIIEQGKDVIESVKSEVSHKEKE